VSERRLPLFPLASVVLFPDSVVPLHVFEPRYRQLTADALAGDRMIGMIAVRPSHHGELAGDPPLYSVGCAGFVTDHRKLADGRYHILLRGTRRFRIATEPPRPPDRLYRVAGVEELEDGDGDPAAAEALRARVIEQLREVSRRTLAEAADAFDPSRLAGLELRRFVGGVCQAVGLPTPEKQGLLEAPDLVERLARLESALAFHLSLGASSVGGETVH
jgi:Lon protease-like protein